MKALAENYEIDFTGEKKQSMSDGGEVFRIQDTCFLDAFSRKFSDRILDKYLIYTKDFAKDEDIFCSADRLVVQFL